MSHGTRENYQDVYGEVLDYAKELFRVLSQSGGPFAPIDNINPNDIHTLAHSVTGMLLHMNWTEIAGEKLPDRCNTIKGKILEALGVFLKMKMKGVDELIPQVCQELVTSRAENVVRQYQQRIQNIVGNLTKAVEQQLAINTSVSNMNSTGASGSGTNLTNKNSANLQNTPSTMSNNSSTPEIALGQAANSAGGASGSTTPSAAADGGTTAAANGTTGAAANGNNSTADQPAAESGTAITSSSAAVASTTPAATEAEAGGSTSSTSSTSRANNPNAVDHVKRVLAQFLFSFWLDVQQQISQNAQPPAGEMHTIGSIIVGNILQSIPEKENDLTPNTEFQINRCKNVVEQLFSTPQEVLCLMAVRLNELTAQLIRLSMELYHRTGYMAIETSRPKMQSFFQYYTIDTTQAEMTSSLLSSHAGATDAEFINSVFSIQLIDSHSGLLDLLNTVDRLNETLVAVDFEGVKLCRSGQLCLIQLTLSQSPTIVYVIDVFHLTNICVAGVCTAKGTSLKTILESEAIEKVWFDPRNDADALYHQFGVYPKNIFDLQLAEVASRRSQGLNVAYVQGLNKVLFHCSALDNTQKKFSEHIGALGKNLFEPACGGDYNIFTKRPLDPQILVYSAHDARYMLELRTHLIENIKDKDNWIPRILQAGGQRVEWCLLPEYFIPNSDAPMF
ncbi:unnamed protein product [Amoebophrya sp. A120]|nr:unnamed protein product [Amoebophrya sp. A120]|eukprot:GSA120T00012231001.1